MNKFSILLFEREGILNLKQFLCDFEKALHQSIAKKFKAKLIQKIQIQ